MKLQDSRTQTVRMKLLKGAAAFLFVAAVIFTLHSMDLLEVLYLKYPALEGESVLQLSSSANNSEEKSTDPPMTQEFCTFKPLSLADAQEERQLLDLIAWPETPVVPTPLVLNQTTDPAHSTFTILPRRGGGEWHVGDQLEVLIKISDYQGHAKKTGGDVMAARLYSKSLVAGVAGRVMDHLNGSYSVVFPLLWEGNAQVEVILIHPSEAVTVLRRLTREHPDRMVFKILFRSGLVSQSTICHFCLRQTSQLQCNYTDPRTGEPWFCYKPQMLNCDARVELEREIFQRELKANEEMLFSSTANMRVYIKSLGPDSVTVLPQKKEQTRVSEDSQKTKLSGYYYQDVWHALDGTRVQQFPNSSAISQCLKGKMVYLFGDSTIRQWFEYLDASLPDAKKFDLKSRIRNGPFIKMDYVNKFLITYRSHGFPLRFASIPVTQVRYVANELDGLNGGADTVVAISVWSHFSPFPIELYIRRLQNIRRAVVRLLNRAPDTLVVIRTANLKDMTLDNALRVGDWSSMQQDKLLRAVFKGLNVRWVDAWEMVLAHYLPHQLHPQPPIIKNMVNLLLSYVCPKK